VQIRLFGAPLVGAAPLVGGVSYCPQFSATFLTLFLLLLLFSDLAAAVLLLTVRLVNFSKICWPTDLAVGLNYRRFLLLA